MKKHIILVAGLLLLSACVAVDTTSDTQGNTSSAAASSEAVPSAARVIEMTATNWQFTPAAVTLQQGENAVIRLAATAGNHGFAVQELGINEAVNEGQTKDITIPTDRPGTYRFRCSVPCGEGHTDMTGTLVIE
ncbi:MAG: cupredoxin domain-containing protein [Candidatus Peribacteraceae bacterium]|nr:cupredoxin domain-containing protein [Candidatus Peribacteraceae bacterium]